MERIVVVGGGAAGMMAAIAAAQAGARVLLLEKTDRLGFKIQISGGGRCNITNDLDDPRELVKMYPSNGRFLSDAFRRFTKHDVLALLARHGVRTKVEAPYDKVFPVSDRSRDVILALEAEMKALGVEIRYETPIAGLEIAHGRVTGVRTTDDHLITADAVIVCVGGRSLPRSGSTGDGYRMAEAAGHRVVDLYPSLVPLRVNGTKPLAGVSLKDVEGTVMVDGKVADRRWRGDMLFTHFGLSGPIVLQLSRAAAEGLHRSKAVELRLNLKPDLSAQEVESELLARINAAPRSQVASLFKDDMPKSVIEPFLEAAGVEATKKVAELSRGDRQRLAETLRAWRFPVTGWHSFEVAEVTAGGVDTKEVDPKTFQSKLVKGLYWAGEVLDVDGYVGGFNFQAAWSSGHAAGTAAAEALLTR
ncbi:NAD(P)/FAD-dependent oxidoreductase [bacterium]|nr:NAD(P)/FAD-dependent oxidoreductase [bacterium]